VRFVEVQPGPVGLRGRVLRDVQDLARFGRRRQKPRRLHDRERDHRRQELDLCIAKRRRRRTRAAGAIVAAWAALAVRAVIGTGLDAFGESDDERRGRDPKDGCQRQEYREQADQAHRAAILGQLSDESTGAHIDKRESLSSGLGRVDLLLDPIELSLELVAVQLFIIRGFVVRSRSARIVQ
jgi:hypothetical protein